MGLVIWGLSQCGRLTSNNQATAPTQTHAQPRIPIPTAAPTPTAKPSSPAGMQPAAVRYVTASSLNLRQTPDTAGAIVAGLPSGTALQVFETRGVWLRVSAGGGVEGWVHGDYTSTTLPRPTVQAAPAPQSIAPAATPGRSRSEIVQLIITSSINSYGGSCPCPYNVDRGGRRCGGRSAYSKPGGASPLCFPDDVSEAMIRAFVQ